MTAIEELQNKITSKCFGILGPSFLDLFEDAKIKEREQIRSAYIDGQDDMLEKFLIKSDTHLNSLHYYNRTFKK